MTQQGSSGICTPNQGMLPLLMCSLSLVPLSLVPSSLSLERSAPSRAVSPSMVLPKAAAAAFFAPWAFTIVVNNLPTEQRLKIQKSTLLQSGAKLRSMKRDERPRVRRVRLSSEVRLVTETEFKKTYSKKELELLWGALLRVYGSQERATEAVRTNSQMLNPSYTFCNTLIESKKCLLGLMSEDEALKVMTLNPAVLQCGPGLELQTAAEIKAFAQLRAAGNKAIPAQARGVLVTLVLTLLMITVAASQPGAMLALGEADQALLQRALEVARPALGAVFTAFFVFIAYASARG